MEKPIQNGTKILFRVVLYLILLALFGIIYAKDAFKMYMSRSTGFGQMQETVEQHEPPVLIICPEPTFKPSFFLDYAPFAESFFWQDDKYLQGFADGTSMLELYANMSYNSWEFYLSGIM